MIIPKIIVTSFTNFGWVDGSSHPLCEIWTDKKVDI